MVLLAVVAFAQPALTAGTAVHVLTGGLDAEWFYSSTFDDQGNETREVYPDVAFWDRWDVLTWTASPVLGLLAAGAVVVALAGLHLAAGWNVSRPARVAAAVAAAATSLVTLAQVLVTFAGTQREGAEESYVGWPTGFVALATPMATLAAVAVFAGVATVVLLRPPWPVPTPTARAAEPLSGPDEGPDEEPHEEPGGAAEPVAPGGPAGPAAVEEPEPASIPRLREEDLAWYRRPTP